MVLKPPHTGLENTVIAKQRISQRLSQFGLAFVFLIAGKLIDRRSSGIRGTLTPMRLRRRDRTARDGKGSRMLLALVLAFDVSVAAATTAHAQAGDSSNLFMTRQTVLSGAPGTIAEATVAVDPRAPQHMAVAADPYLRPTRIEVARTNDGGEHWSAGQEILPPGFTKSYDPQLTFTADGTLLVSGGASTDTRNHCLGSSVVFVAAINAEGIDYRIVAAAPSDGLLDRPTMLSDPPARRVMIAWTASRGPGAECRARPDSSSTQVAKLSPLLGVTGIVTLAPAGRAPFGSALAVDGGGTLGLVVAARTGNNSVITTYESKDGVSWTANPVGHGQPEPDSLPGLGGFVLSMPSIAGLPDGFAVAWTDATEGPMRTRLAIGAQDKWQEVAAPPSDGTRLLPTLAAADGNLMLAQAAVTQHSLRFLAWKRLNDRWLSISDDDIGNGANRDELGELLGLGVGPSGSQIAAAPSEVSGGSALMVRTRPPNPPPPSSPATAAPAHSAAPGHSGASNWRSATIAGACLFAVVAGTTVGAVARSRRRRKRRAV